MRTTPSIISSWKLMEYCSQNGIHPENLTDFANALERLIVSLHIGPAEKSRLIPAVIKNGTSYLFSETQDQKSLSHVLRSGTDEPAIAYEAKETGYADSVELWMDAGTTAHMVAKVIKDPKINSEYFCLTRYSVFFELPVEQAWWFVDFIRGNTKINSLLGVFQ